MASYPTGKAIIGLWHFSSMTQDSLGNKMCIFPSAWSGGSIYITRRKKPFLEARPARCLVSWLWVGLWADTSQMTPSISFSWSQAGSSGALSRLVPHIEGPFQPVSLPPECSHPYRLWRSLSDTCCFSRSQIFKLQSSTSCEVIGLNVGAVKKLATLISWYTMTKK